MTSWVIVRLITSTPPASRVAVIRSCIKSSDIPAAMSRQRAGLKGGPRGTGLWSPLAPDFLTSSRAVLSVSQVFGLDLWGK